MTFRCGPKVRGLAVAIVALSSARPSGAVNIQIDTTTRYQTLAGWESILSGLEVTESGTYSPAWVQQAPKIVSFLVNEMGINRVRVELASGSENPGDYFADFQAGKIDYDGLKAHFYEKINDNDDPRTANASGFHFGMADFRVENELLPIKHAVEQNGEKLYVTVCYVDFAGTQFQGSLHHGTTPDEYAELVTVFFDHLKNKYGVVPDALEVVLEPENTNDWRGKQIGQGAATAAARLKAAGYSPHFIAPSTMNASNAIPYFNDAIGAGSAASVFTMLSYHRYGSGDYDAIYQAARARGIQTGMLEFFTASVDDLLQDLTVANVSAWEKYAIVSPKQNSDYAYLYADVSAPSSPIVSFSAKAAQMMPYFRFARIGAVRVGAVSSSGAIAPVAFVNTNGTNVVVVKGDGAPLEVTGIRNGAYGVRNVASDGRIANAADVTATNGTLKVTVPSGVTAIYDRNALKGGSSMGTGGASGTGGAAPAGGASGAAGGTSTGGIGGGAAAGSGGSAPGGTTAAGGRTTSGSGAKSFGGMASTGGKATSVSGGRTSSTEGNGGRELGERDGGTRQPLPSTDAAGCGCRVRNSASTRRVPWLAILGPALGVSRLVRGGRRRD